MASKYVRNKASIQITDMENQNPLTVYLRLQIILK